MSDKSRAYSDARLVEIFQADTEAAEGRSAASELLRRYQRAVYLWCFRYVKEHEHALDLAQDVLLSAYRALPSFRGDAKFSSWLFAMARNRCVNALRRGNVFLELEVVEDTLADRGPMPDIEMEEREGEERVLRLIADTLDPIEQRAIWLRCAERLPVEEITLLLNLDSGSGARGLLQTARRKLRAALAGQNPKTEEGGV